MASPPNYSNTSPPAPSSLALPRQRPTLSLPNGSNAARRKPSTTSASAAALSAHPLRQTSFPPQDRFAGSLGDSNSHLAFSPTESADVSDSEITSAISGPAGEVDGGGRKRKRGEKRNRGRPPKKAALRQGSLSLVNGVDDGKRSRRGGTAGASSVAVGEGEDDEDDDEDEDEGAARAVHFEQDRYIANDRARIDLHQQMPLFQQERHDSWHRAKLRTADVRRLVNQTLSQSVPANVVTVVQAYTKMFAGILIEGAREVQSEWMAVESQRADGEENPPAKKLRRSEDDNIITESGPTEADAAMREQTQINGHVHSDDTQPDTQPQDSSLTVGEDANEGTSAESLGPPSEATGLRRLIDECDRGPLLAHHLRESLRRYKKSRYGGTVGFTGLSLQGKDVAAARVGGRRLFR